MAPEGPPPMIAICAIPVFRRGPALSSPERIPHTNPRRLPTRGCSGKTSSGDGEDHQAKTSQEYSTEYRCSGGRAGRSEEHTSELQSRGHLVCRLLLEKKNKKKLII